jgi:hydrogenase expression/formation protein HypC
MCLGIPGRVVSIEDASRKLAMVEIGGVKRQVNLACVADGARPLESCIGEWVLVHVGFAMARINEQEAAETLRILEALGEAQAEIDAMQRSAVE